MEQITWRSAYSQTLRRVQSHRFPLYMRIAVAIVMSLAAVNIAAWTIPHYTQLASNPFMSFSDIMPGQPKGQIESEGFTCHRTDRPDIALETCTRDLSTGSFRQVQLTISWRNTIHDTTFIAREGTLRLGDLIRLLGRPEIHRYGVVTHFMWSSRAITSLTTLQTTPQPSFYLPLSTVTFTDTGSDDK
jgi:hypothetical protein